MLSEGVRFRVTPPRVSHPLQYAYEDSMDLIAKLPTLASAIYCNLYRDGKVSGKLNPLNSYS